jgi:transcriptional regulator with XRE-family HTH domain/quercetin dioxygenase-like cupin family protein
LASQEPTSFPESGPSAAETGERLRQRRRELGISARELARRVSLSASLISQIERGATMPSVASLYAIVSELGLSLDELFSLDGNAGGAPPTPPPPDPVVRASERESLTLASGVHWQRLTRNTDPRADFHYLVYEPGGASCDEGVLVRHSGHEYGHVISGRLHVTLGFSEHELGPGDSISFDSAQPHRLATVGDEPVHAVWVVVGRVES